jgi:hypothetical protein
MQYLQISQRLLALVFEKRTGRSAVRPAALPGSGEITIDAAGLYSFAYIYIHCKG